MRTTVPSVMATGWGIQEREFSPEHQKPPSSPPYFGGMVEIKIPRDLPTPATKRGGHAGENELERALVESHPQVVGS
jgi:hypothetical protein